MLRIRLGPAHKSSEPELIQCSVLAHSSPKCRKQLVRARIVLRLGARVAIRLDVRVRAQQHLLDLQKLDVSFLASGMQHHNRAS